MSATITRVTLGVVALSLCAACNASGASEASSQPSGSAPAPAVSASTPAPKKPRKTTSADSVVRTVHDKIRTTRKQLELTPDNLMHLEALMSLLLVRSSRLGKISDLDEVVALGERAVKNGRKLKEAHRIRSKAYSAVHRFDEALKDMDKAEELGASKSKIALSRAAVLIALGRPDDAMTIIEARKKSSGEKFEVLFAEAMALGHMARYAEADAAYEKALAKYRALSPLVVAHLDFERGAMWDRAGDEKKATQYYRAAVERLPMFAHAAGHLAYKLPRDEAIALVRGLIETSDDPEYVGTLGYLMNQQKPGSGDVHIEKAKGLYAELMKKHPLAFADHAGWFYVIIAKDSERAIEAAEMNLDNRPAPEAYELMLAALVAAQHGTEACDVADRAVAVKYPTPGLKRYAAKAYDLCGRADEATELRASLKSAK